MYGLDEGVYKNRVRMRGFMKCGVWMGGFIKCG